MGNSWIDDDPLKLFAVFVGGKHPRANIELHDVQFVVAHTIEDTVPALRERWWGEPSSLHIDAYAIINIVDSTLITPVPQPKDAPMSGMALYFLNTGGYQEGVFGEMHAYSFHVSRRHDKDKAAVWREAKRRAPHFSAHHKDNFERIDDIICVDDVIQNKRYTLAYDHLPGVEGRGPYIVAKYMKL
jgi:hypothetical protein